MNREHDFSTVNLPYDFRDSETKENDEHWQQWRDGDLNDCKCSLCQFWNEQNARDMEKV